MHGPPRDGEADAEVDQMMAELLERYDEETVRTVIRRILADRHPFRTATVGLDVRSADGVRIGTAAVWTLRELNQTQDSVS